MHLPPTFNTFLFLSPVLLGLSCQKNDPSREAALRSVNETCRLYADDFSIVETTLNKDTNGSFDVIGLRKEEASILLLIQLTEKLGEHNWELSSYRLTFTDPRRFHWNIGPAE